MSSAENERLRAKVIELNASRLQRADAVDKLPLKLTLEAEYEYGEWFVTSPDLPGFFATGSGLEDALGQVVGIGLALCGAMEEERAAGRQTPEGAKQHAKFIPYFGVR